MIKPKTLTGPISCHVSCDGLFTVGDFSRAAADRNEAANGSF